MIDIKSFNTINNPTWCPGCGNFGIITAIKNSLVSQNINSGEIVFVYGIGCNSNMFNSLKVQGVESLHGRPIPVAEGIRLANPKVPVVVVAGDGDTFSEGGNHLIHVARRNINVTLIVHDNRVFALTTGQTAPNAPKGFKSKSTPLGTFEMPFNPLSIVLSAGATFVARSFAGDIKHLENIITEAIKHKGFSFVDVLQPCVTFNKINTYEWYKKRIYKLEETNYKPDNRESAIKKAYEEFYDDKLPIGIFFKEEKPSYEEQLPQHSDISLRDSVPNEHCVEEILKEYI